MNETKCEIVFVNSVGSKGDVYYSGQQITGSVVISVYDKQEIKGFFLCFYYYFHYDSLAFCVHSFKYIFSCFLFSDFRLLLEEIKIKLLGIGQSQWTEQRRSFVGEETYLQHEIQLMRPSSNESKFKKKEKKKFGQKFN